MQEPLLNKKQAAAILGVSLLSMNRLMYEIGFVRVGLRRIMFSAQALKDYIELRMVAPRSRGSKIGNRAQEKHKCPNCGEMSPNLERDRNIRSCYAHGATLAELSLLNSITKGRIRQIIGRDNIRFEDTRGLLERKKRNLEMYKMSLEGFNKSDIAKKYNLSRARVSQIIKIIEYRRRRQKNDNYPLT